MTTVIVLPIQNPTWNGTDDALLAYISETRKNIILRYNFEEDRKLSLYAALLTQMQLSIHTKIPVNQLMFEKGEHKKPYLCNDSNVHFNFSHTKSCILLGISDAPIGVDVEKVKEAPYSIMDSVFHPAEIMYIDHFKTEPIKSSRFFQIWTKKEALLKYNGTGLTNHLEQINTLDSNHEAHYITWEHDSYVCSVYVANSTITTELTVTEQMIQDYYLS